MSILQEGIRFLTQEFAEAAFAAALGVAGTLGVLRYRKYKGKKALIDKNFNNKFIPIIEFRYIHCVDPSTQEPYKRQEKRGFGFINLERLLDENVTPLFFEYLDMAGKKCTPGHNVIWEHLYEVLPPKLRDATLEIVAHFFRQNVSELINGDKVSLIGTLKSDEEYDECVVYPMLVMDDDDGIKQLRLYLVHDEHLRPGYFDAGNGSILLRNFSGSDGRAYKRAWDISESDSIIKHKAIAETLVGYDTRWIAAKFQTFKIVGVKRVVNRLLSEIS